MIAIPCVAGALFAASAGRFVVAGVMFVIALAEARA